MDALPEPTRLTRRERELLERPFCRICGVAVVRGTSELIDGRLWCLDCHHGTGRRRSARRKLSRFRRHLFQANPCCAYCGLELQWETSTIDHVIPCSRGGTNARENLVLSCQPCNSRKASRLITPGDASSLEPPLTSAARFADLVRRLRDRK